VILTAPHSVIIGLSKLYSSVSFASASYPFFCQNLKNMYFMKNKFLLATHFNFVTKEAARQRSPL